MPATFTLSFDLELAWGEFYRRPVDVERLLAARKVLPLLLQALARHNIRATFAVVGHLLLDGCDGHHDMPRPQLDWRPGDWYAGDPCTDEAHDPAWYAPSLVAAIRQEEPGHDVGGHGFSHLPLDVAGVNRAVAQAELAACAKALSTSGKQPFSFVYPRNGIGYVELLQQNGFACFRAVEPRWYAQRPKPVRKLAHMFEQICAVTPSVGRVDRQDGVVAAPSSMLFWSREGFRRRIPIRARVTRACRGLDRAVMTGQIFHMWMHAEDFVPDSPLMLDGVEAVFSHAQKWIQQGRLEVRTMAELAVAPVPERST